MEQMSFSVKIESGNSEGQLKDTAPCLSQKEGRLKNGRRESPTKMFVVFQFFFLSFCVWTHYLHLSPGKSPK